MKSSIFCKLNIIRRELLTYIYIYSDILPKSLVPLTLHPFCYHIRVYYPDYLLSFKTILNSDFVCNIRFPEIVNRIGSVMVSVVASSVVDGGFKSRLDQTKDYKTGKCCFSAKHAVLRGQSKDCGFTQNQDNVSECSYMSTRGTFFQSASYIKIQLSVLV
jgi:hypothetical protein